MKSKLNLILNTDSCSYYEYDLYDSIIPFNLISPLNQFLMLREAVVLFYISVLLLQVIAGTKYFLYYP